MALSKDFRKNYIKQYGKKAYEEFCKQQRTTSGFNTGTRYHKTEKDYQRKPKHRGKMFEDR